MPVFDRVCTCCGHQEEVIETFSEETAIIECPVCRAEAYERQTGSGGLIKGLETPGKGTKQKR